MNPEPVPIEAEPIALEEQTRVDAPPPRAPEPLQKLIARVGAQSRELAEQSRRWANSPAEHEEPSPSPLIGLPRLFREATVQELLARVGSLSARKQFALDTSREKRVVFVGPPGSGKTSLAVAMLRARYATIVRRPLFMAARKLAFAPQTWPLGNGDPPEFYAAKNARVLLLDDLGRDPPTPGNPVASVIDERYDEDLVTWITTFMSPDQVEQRYDAGCARRVFEDSIIIDCGAP